VDYCIVVGFSLVGFGYCLHENVIKLLPCLPVELMSPLALSISATTNDLTERVLRYSTVCSTLLLNFTVSVDNPVFSVCTAGELYLGTVQYSRCGSNSKKYRASCLVVTHQQEREIQGRTVRPVQRRGMREATDSESKIRIKKALKYFNNFNVVQTRLAFITRSLKSKA